MNSTSLGTGIVGIVIGFLLITLAIYWLAFPVFVYYALRRQEAILRMQEILLRSQIIEQKLHEQILRGISVNTGRQADFWDNRNVHID